MTELFEYNMAVLIRLIADVRAGTANPWPEDFTPEFRAFAAQDPEVMALGASVAWSTLGISVWSSGQHVPSSSVAEIDSNRDGLMNAHVERLLESVR
jgi:hypothetical protein